jgi:Fe-S-cluster containining protein
MATLCLSQHADYRCLHSGACCTSSWPIHIEPDRRDTVLEALADGRLAIPGKQTNEPLDDGDDVPPGAGAVLRITSSGACVFYDRDGRRCAIHRDLGHASLPSACQHFPRRCLIERDGVRVSLSHYCPTVARMALTDGGPRGIVEAPASLAGRFHLEGLDARDALPPLLRPGMLADLDGYHAWERAAVEVLEAGEAPEDALFRIRAMTESVQSWSPGQTPLRHAVERAAQACRTVAVRGSDRARRDESLRAAFDLVRNAVPEPFRPGTAPTNLGALDARRVAPAWHAVSRPLCRFLAAHAFGNWYAYLGTSLTTVVRSLEAALAVVRVEAASVCAQTGRPLDEPLLVEAFRAADLLLVHLADPKVLAAGLEHPRFAEEQA